MQQNKGVDVKNYLKSRNNKVKFIHYPIKSQVISLLRDQGFERPTLVQSQSLPITLQENLKDLCTIVYAYNGAGKTLTYLIPILNSLEMISQNTSINFRGKEYEGRRPQALIILPTEALMTQVYDYLTSYATYYQVTYKWPLTIGQIYGSDKNTSGHIIVGLTVKMKENIVNKTKFDFSQLKWIVFDECDKIKDDTFDDFKQILKEITSISSTNSTNLIITSATGDKVSFREFIQSNLPNHNIIELDSKEKNMGLEGVTHFYSTAQNKDQVILNILGILSGLQSKPQVIVFFNEIAQLQHFYSVLKKERVRFHINDVLADSKGKNNLAVSYIHGRVGSRCTVRHEHNQQCQMSKSSRTQRLRNQQIQVLLGTETIGRGIDIRTVSLVINYSEPKKNKQQYSAITYIHRVGRTGRYTDEGVALTFISDKNFLRLTQQSQKISFMEMVSQKQIVEQALICSKKNSEIKQEQLRWETQ